MATCNIPCRSYGKCRRSSPINPTRKCMSILFQQLEKLRETILSNDILKKNISLRLPGKRYPSLIIYDLTNDTTNEDVQIALKAYSNWGEDLRLRFKMRGRKEETSHWVLEAPCEAFFNLRRLRKIPIKWAMYQMKEFLHIKRC
ncbi:hypothetical protein AVEN_151531-1 [Araneus ventricosus]|uniref:Uncharacterized protein n=1 Tax=Araneus ventricosus TaxID=182803 RepID=A0A4Y2TK33_ARAVE|nr:hypothetical protein AVEN_151531-1 [Araneus ventricosus]